MNPKLQPLLYGLSVFAVYAVLTVILRFIANKFPEDAIVAGIFSRDDILLGLGVAVLLTFSHERKKRLKNK